MFVSKQEAARRQQQSTGLFHLNRFDSMLLFPKEKTTPWVAIAVQDTVVE